MSTTVVESWAVDLAELGAIYPFVGSEVLLVVLTVIAWIGWHVWQMRHEKEEEEAILNDLRNSPPSSSSDNS